MGLLRASGDSALRRESAAVAPDSAQSGIRISLLTRVVAQSYSHHTFLSWRYSGIDSYSGAISPQHFALLNNSSFNVPPTCSPKAYGP
jgi:hypothetical protein